MLPNVTTRGLSIAATLVLALASSSRAQSATAEPASSERCAALAGEARILARLLERKLDARSAFSSAQQGRDGRIDSWNRLYYELKGGSASGEPGADPAGADPRVVGEEPPPSGTADTVADWIRLAKTNHLYASRLGLQVRAIRSAAVPGTGALIWIECEAPGGWVRPTAEAHVGDPAQSEWERARRELEGAPAAAAGEGPKAPPAKHAVDPRLEDEAVRAIQEVVLQHAVRISALEGAESITVLLHVRTTSELDRLLSSGEGGGFDRLLYTRFYDVKTRDADAGARSTEHVRILRCPRVSAGGETPRELITVARYEVR
jgi:hypothetical protein